METDKDLSSVSGENQDITRDKKGRFVPGQSGNPGGKYSGTKSIPNIITRLGSELSNGTDINRLEAVVEKLFQLAEKGNIRAIELIFKRLEGDVPKQLKIESNSTKSPYEIFCDGFREAGERAFLNGEDDPNDA